MLLIISAGVPLKLAILIQWRQFWGRTRKEGLQIKKHDLILLVISESGPQNQDKTNKKGLAAI